MKMIVMIILMLNEDNNNDIANTVMFVIELLP